MTRFLGFALFLSIACAIIAGVHYYFWVRLVRDTQLQGAARHLATSLVVGLAALIVATALAGRLAPRLGRVLAWPGFIWMGTMFILLVILLGSDFLRLLAAIAARVASSAGGFDPSRRLFTARLVAGAVLTGTAGVTAAAVRATQSEIAVKRLEVTLDSLPAGLDGTKIVRQVAPDDDENYGAETQEGTIAP